jgi:anti-sigma factor ChrR (cupin superfamily)
MIDAFIELNADFTQRVVINPNEYVWEASPMPGVERMKLDRIGDEIARATSLVRYAPNSSFSPHEHVGGEEIFVLEGTLYDEYAIYPAGSWLRSPHLSEHCPYTKDVGALIYVKVGHLHANEIKASN